MKDEDQEWEMPNMRGIQSPLSMGFWSEAYIRCADVIIIKGAHAMNIYMESNDMFF